MTEPILEPWQDQESWEEKAKFYADRCVERDAFHLEIIKEAERKIDELRKLAGELLRVIELAPARCGEKDLIARAKKLLGKEN